MKPTFFFEALLFPAFLLGAGVLPLHAESLTIPPASRKPAESERVKASQDPIEVLDPFAVVNTSRLEPTAPEMVQVQVEFIELSHKALGKLLFLADPDTTNGTALRKKLQAMVEKDEAAVLDTQVVVSVSGMRRVVGNSGRKTTTESIHEFIYPTEYEPPSLPCSFTSGPSSVIAGENAIPTAFDTRNLGATLEAEPTIDEDGKLIDVRLVSELVWHTGNTSHLERKNALGHIYKLEMPDFYAIRLNTSVTCVTGQYLMAAVLSPKDSEGNTDMTRKVMVFVKCDVLTVK